ncbi:MAG: penicillin-binding protein beta-lactamase class, partial [Verrucomicrobiaceae bacterium]|nr:penicillin-binding protein beta-lactamase class [Verrucomicrobiaceae bacterium]
MTGYGPHPRTESYCRDLTSILEYNTTDQREEKATPDTLARAVKEVAEKEIQTGRLPGMAVGVLLNNKVAYFHGYGVAQGFDPDHTATSAVSKVEVTENTMFRWGSVIKTVTATTALRLIEEGKMHLDDNIQTYVGSFPNKTNPGTNVKAVITPRYLLCHESGLPHYPDKAFIKKDTKYTFVSSDSDPEDVVGAFEQSTLMFPPGQQFHYSSYGYMLLSAAIESAGGAPFADVMQQKVMKPLALGSLVIDHSNAAALPGYAEGYT